jgi:hypothetical protein
MGALVVCGAMLFVMGLGVGIAALLFRWATGHWPRGRS